MTPPHLPGCPPLNAYDGTASGGASIQYSSDTPVTIVGADGQASTHSLSFDGSNDYVEPGRPRRRSWIFPKAPSQSTAWIKTTDSNRAVILGSYDAANPCINFEIGSAAYGSGAIRAYMQGGGGSVNLWGNEAVYDGQWRHVAMVYTGPGADNVMLYVDGELDATGTCTGSLYSIAASTVVLGKDLRSSGVPHYNGLMDQVRISGQALVPKQFLLAGRGEQNYYRMETDGGTQAVTGAATTIDDTGLHPFTYNGTALAGGGSTPTYSTDVPDRLIVRDGVELENKHSLSFNGTWRLRGTGRQDVTDDPPPKTTSPLNCSSKPIMLIVQSS